MTTDRDEHRRSLEDQLRVHISAERWLLAAGCEHELADLAEDAGEIAAALVHLRSAHTHYLATGTDAAPELFECCWAQALLLVDLDRDAEAADAWIAAADHAIHGGTPDAAVEALELAVGAFESVGAADRSAEVAVAAARAAQAVAALGEPMLLEAATELIEDGGGSSYAAPLDRLRQRAARDGDRATVARCTRLLALVARAEGRPADARRGLDQALEAFVALEMWLEAAATSSDAGLLAAQGGNLGEAARLLRDAVAQADSAGDQVSAGHHSAVLGSCLFELRDWRGAADCLRRAADVASQTGSVQDAATHLHDLAQCLMRLGEADDAVAALHRAADLDQDGSEGVASGAWSEIAFINRDLGRTEQAWRAADRAVQLAADGTARRKGRFEQLMLQIAQDPSPAVRREFSALRDEFSETGELDRAASCDVTLGEEAHARGDLMEAELRWDSALEHFGATGNDEMLARTYAAQGNRYGLSRGVDRAIECYARAQALFGSAGLLSDAQDCAVQLARLGHMKGAPFDSVSGISDPGQIAPRAAAFDKLARGIQEVNFTNFGRAADLLTAAMAWFDDNGLLEESLEARLALATAQVGRGRYRRSEDLIAQVLARTGGGEFPRARGGALMTIALNRIAGGDIGAAVAALHEAVRALERAGAPGQAAQARLNLGLLAAHCGDPEEAMQQGAAAGAEFTRCQLVDLAARAELICAIGLSRRDAWATAFDVAAPAMLVIDTIRAGITSSRDRANWRAAWTWAHDTVLDIIAHLGDPRTTAEVVERWRANAAPAGRPGPSDLELALQASQPGATTFSSPTTGAPTIDDGPPVATWSAGAAALGDDTRVAVTLPPVVRMPWGDALGPYERLAQERIAPLSARHRAPRETAVWAEQIGFI